MLSLIHVALRYRITGHKLYVIWRILEKEHFSDSCWYSTCRKSTWNLSVSAEKLPVQNKWTPVMNGQMAVRFSPSQQYIRCTRVNVFIVVKKRFQRSSAKLLLDHGYSATATGHLAMGLLATPWHPIPILTRCSERFVYYLWHNHRIYTQTIHVSSLLESQPWCRSSVQ